MDMQAVDSSNIERIGYDAGSSTLRIEFQSGRTYDYSGVPAGVFEELRAAPSVGGYHAKYIKNAYPYAEI